MADPLTYLRMVLGEFTQALEVSVPAGGSCSDLLNINFGLS
jgi:hypothetical protein